MKRIILVLAAAVFITSTVFASDLQLETIGAAGGSNLYLTYMSIGVIADSHTKGVYNKEQTVSFVNAVIGQAKVQKDYLDKLIKSKEVSDADAAFLKRMIDCYTLLTDEGKFLIEYVNTGKESALTAYDSKREKAWTLISELLGLKQ